MKQLKERRRSLGLKKFFKLTLLTILVSCATENKPEVNYADEFKSILGAFETSSILDLEDAYFEKVDFLEAYIDTLTDITLIYRSSKRTFWDFLCGDMNEATVLINSFDIPNHLRGKDYSVDNEGREEFRNFLEEIWQKKDEAIEREKKKFGIEKVF